MKIITIICVTVELNFRERNTNIKWSLIERWPAHPLLAKTVADRITTELKQFPLEKQKDVIILFSAHSLPLKVTKYILNELHAKYLFVITIILDSTNILCPKKVRRKVQQVLQ